MENPSKSIDENGSTSKAAAAAAASTAAMSEDDDGLDDSNVVTMVEVLEQENELEKEYVAVLGASDEKCCTYSRGYIKRQALYACLTCKPDSRTNPDHRAGVCLACSYKCHEGHEMIELYTKRNFRCDCGTARMPEAKCTLDCLKLQENSDNIYNQNFSGTYCTCHRPYPDPDDPIPDEMIQCIICEDWFHCRHLGDRLPTSNQFTEMICVDCTTKHSDILLHYRGFSVFAAPAEEEDGRDKEVDVVVSTEAAAAAAVQADTSENDVDMVVQSAEAGNGNEKSPKIASNEINEMKKPRDDDDGLKNEINQCILDIIEINKSNSDEIDEPHAKRSKIYESMATATTSTASTTVSTAESVANSSNNSSRCRRPPRHSSQFSGASFWPFNWRQHICTCNDCRIQLQQQNVNFLADLDDTVLAYEEKGIAKAHESQYDSGMKVLENMNHMQKIDVIMGYNKMKEKLVEFLNAFVTSKQVVTEEDIKRFFRMLNEKNDSNGMGDDKSTVA